MSADTLVYYLLGMVVLSIGGLGVGILIAGRLSRRYEAAHQGQDETQAAGATNSDDQ